MFESSEKRCKDDRSSEAEARHGPVEYQRSLCDPDVLRKMDEYYSDRPSTERFLAVLTGQSEWEPSEREMIERSPALQEFERGMRAALFGPLPQLRAPATTPLRPVLQNAAGPELQLAASASNQPSDPIRLPMRAAAREQSLTHGEVRSITAEGKIVRLFAHPSPDRTTLHILDGLPAAPIEVAVDGVMLELVEAFDRFGRTVVRTSDVKGVIEARSTLSIRTARQQE